jgi:hypothetical protein
MCHSYNFLIKLKALKFNQKYLQFKYVSLNKIFLYILKEILRNLYEYQSKSHFKEEFPISQNLLSKKFIK